MRLCALLAVLASFSCASTGPNERAPWLSERSVAYAVVESFEWREERGGSELLKETGPLLGAGFEHENRQARFRAELYGGVVDYDGQTQDGTPLSTDTGYFGVIGEADWKLATWGGSASGEEGAAFAPENIFTPYVGGGLNAWVRDLQTTTQAYGYTERWLSFYGHAGLDYSRWLEVDQRLYADVRVGLSLYNREFVDLSHIPGYEGVDVDLNPDLGPMVRLEVGWDRKALHLALFFDYTKFGESDVSEGFLQPESTRSLVGVVAGFGW